MGFLSRLFGKRHDVDDAELSPSAVAGRPGIDRSSKSSSSETIPPAAPAHDKASGARVDVGKCEKCGRPIRVKQSGVKPTMRLTCKCGHVNVIGSATASSYVEDIRALLGRGIDPDEVRKHIQHLKVPADEADEIDKLLSRAGASMPSKPSSNVNNDIPPEHKHFVENAAAMLSRGVSEGEVELNLRQLGFDTHLVANLLNAAKKHGK